VCVTLCCFTDCSTEAIVCVERVQMAVMRNSVHTTTLISYTHTHTQGRKLGCLSTWNDYSSSNEIAAWQVFFDYSLNRDGQANTPAQMSVFSSGVCARLRVCLYVFAAYFLLDSFRHSCNESHRHHPLTGLIAINQTSTMASPSWLNDRH